MDIRWLTLSLLLVQLGPVWSREIEFVNSTLEFEGMTYSISERKVTRDTAQEECWKLGASLVMIRNLRIQTALRVTIDKMMTSSQHYGKDSAFWLGLTKLDQSGKVWKWEDGKILTERNGFSYWSMAWNEWWSGIQDCAVFIHSLDEAHAGWSRSFCNGKAGFICEQVSFATTVKFAEHEYSVVDTRVSKSNAESICEAEGGTLATIDNLHLQNTIGSTIESFLLDSGRLNTLTSYWINLIKSNMSSWWNGRNFVSHDPSETFWAPGEPRHQSPPANCAVLFYSPENPRSAWKAAVCEEDMARIICQNRRDPCWKNPCRHGTCHNMSGRYECSCYLGRYGRHCKLTEKCSLASLKSKYNLFTSKDMPVIADKVKVNKTVFLECDKIEEILIGNNQLTCVHRDTWDKAIDGKCVNAIQCPPIHQLDFGDMEVTGGNTSFFEVGSKIRFRCDRGFSTKGPAVIKCEESGVWSEPVPFCAAMSCRRDETRLESGRLCPQLCRVTSDCTDQSTKCMCDDWCGKSCYDEEKQCEPLKVPSFGYILGTQRSYGHTVMYGCYAGFLPNGPTKRKCRSDGKWSGIAPQCVSFSTCGLAGDIGNSLLSHSVEKVANGQKAPTGAWPWQAALLHNNKNNVTQSLGALLGGASIISEKWVLTASHLFTYVGAQPDSLTRRFFIVVGLTEIPTSSDTLPPNAQVYQASEVHQHPNYNRRIFDYDVALLRIGSRMISIGGMFVVDRNYRAGQLTFTYSVRPICLPCINDRHVTEERSRSTKVRFMRFVASHCARPKLKATQNPLTVVTGFGEKRPQTMDLLLQSQATSSGRLLQGLLKILPAEKCIEGVKRIRSHGANRHAFFSARFTNRMLCTGSGDPRNTVDACLGDSGGPLMQKVTSVSGHSYWVQVGIVSWGWGCANTDSDGFTYPGYFVDLVTVMDWISGVIFKEEPKTPLPTRQIIGQRESVTTIKLSIMELPQRTIRSITIDRRSSIEDIKRLLQSSLTPIAKLRIFYKKNMLSDHRTLTYYGVESGDLLYVVTKN